MKITVLSLFPEIVDAFFQSSIMAKAVDKNIIEYSSVNIRDFALDKHRTCDDYPYGGGAGMVLKPEPLVGALDSVQALGKRVVYPSPSGRLFNQEFAKNLADEQELVFICGRYEGIDHRVIQRYVTDEISIGDYVVSSGEVATLTIIDAVYRLVDGVINQESLVEESHNDGLLEYPHFTRPEKVLGIGVPDVLLSGNHAAINAWRRGQQLRKTKHVRPDLFAKKELTKEDARLLAAAEEQGGSYGSHKGY
ncbi:tRNA (guanosine(37)-N1)-methyltransferase TrmD [Spirochaeta lutea]|uniref:tRNA (guanosine(37)-N1)-methyltransferase TrmD n=1 Tax=Spirochaeta lutea TaxID=1480694 RepID=UPI00068BD142|nr:tRNA (guanosine(37)-N1)-methyltransferase TrmD [Spirochaeta lutea]